MGAEQQDTVQGLQSAQARPAMRKVERQQELPVIHRFDDVYRDIGGKRWYNGLGSPDADIVFVDSWPGDEIRRTNRPLADRVGRCLQWLLKCAGISPSRCYYTYAVKWSIPNGKKPSATDRKLCATMLSEEISAVGPKVVVAFGADAWAAVADVRSYPFACCRGEPVAVDEELVTPMAAGESDGHEKRRTWLFPTFNLSQVMMNGGEGYRDRLKLEDIPQHILVHRAVHELGLVKRLADGEDLKATYAASRPTYDVLTTAEQVEELHKALKTGTPDGLICLDCEWDGRNWLDPDRYIRTVQLGVARGYTAIVKLHEAGGVPVAADLRPIWTALKALLEDPAFGIVGHNVISDGEWLLQEGIDIREHVVYDTMLGEYLLCEDGPFGLEEAAMKYGPYGRYCSELECWVKRNGKLCKLGFGNVPDEILMPYGAADVDVLRYIMEAQLPMIEKCGYMEKRGTEKQYPSMLQETLNTQKVLYEVEGIGMPVDRRQLDMLIDKFQSKKAELLSAVVLGAEAAGMPNFNPGAPGQVKELLFKKLGLPPVKTTAGKDWAEAVGNVGLDEDIEEAPGTDKQTLEILSDRHPLCKALLQYRRIETPCKTWLRHKDENNTDRGLEAQLWADGRLHSHMSQLSTTSRFKSSTPNCFPREVEVLTSKGWLHWDEAYAQRDTDIQLAQWDPNAEDRAITFAAPTEWHTGRNSLLHVHNKEQLDIVCTPDHRFEVYTRRFAYGHKTLPAHRLSNCGELSIPGCGVIHTSPGKIHLSDAQVTLLCAVQADGRLNAGSRGITLSFAKERKIERMRNALNALGFDYSEATGHYSYRKPMTRFYIKRKHINEAFASQKVFNDLFQYDAETIRKIADEIVHWDGMVRTHGRSAGHKEYFSSIEQNIDWVQAVEVVSGYRARKLLRRADETNVNSKPRWVVSIPAVVHDVSTRNTVAEPLPEADVYCATMPMDTLIVRYNGNVLFTRNSQNFPKKAEGFMTEIFGAGNEPPVVRTIVVPPDGMVMMEADLNEGPVQGDLHCKRK